MTRSYCLNTLYGIQNRGMGTTVDYLILITSNFKKLDEILITNQIMNFYKLCKESIVNI